MARLNPSEIVGPSLKQDIKPFQIVPDEVINLPEEITKKYGWQVNSILRKDARYRKSLYSNRPRNGQIRICR